MLSRALPLNTVPQDEGHRSHPSPRESELVLRKKKMFLCFLNMTACLVEQFEQFVVNNMRVKLLEFPLSSMVQGLKANKEYLNTE